jgi:tRNA1Val (adenine37-N6)-methyltransferase
MKTTMTPFLGGRIRVHQPASGYRFNVDSVCLAAFSWVRAGESVLDLGTGSGILLLLLAHFHLPVSLLGVELQPELAELASRNFAENGWSAFGRAAAADFREPGAFPEGAFELAVCNPPYYEAGRSLPSPDERRAMSRHSLSAGFADVLSAGASALKARGRLCLLCPAPRFSEVLALAPASGLTPRVVRWVRPSLASEPHLALVQFRKEACHGPLTLPPLTLREDSGDYTGEVALWLGEGEPPEPRFLCDVMVGRLARYLRLAGFDAAYTNRAEDEWLLAQARRSGRALITRDRPLLTRCKKEGVRAFDPRSDAPREQLARVREAFPVEADRGPRCLDCDAPVLEVERREALGKVPPYTYLTHERFSACPCCGKLTWEGSHLDRFRKDVAGGKNRGKEIG